MSKPRKTRKPKRDIYAEVTDKVTAELEALLAQIEAGTAPKWTCPWSRSGAAMPLPTNAKTGRRYNGVNVFLLWFAQHDGSYLSSAWGTYKQLKAMGGQVRKGEKGTAVTLWKPLHIPEKDATGRPIINPATGKPRKKKVLMLKTFTVFNVEQTDGIDLDAHTPEQPELTGGFEPVERIEQWIADTGAKITDNGASAGYSPSLDTIKMPSRERFEHSADYYATATHELAHWTGHESRLARIDRLSRFGDESYAMEELVAEMSSAFACAALGIEGRMQHAEYLANWIKVLRSDSRAIFTAASAARAAFEYLEDAVTTARGEAVVDRYADDDSTPTAKVA